MLGHIVYGVAIPLQAFACDGLEAGHAGVGNLTELLALLHCGYMDLDGGDTNCLERIENRDARMRVSGGVDNDAAEDAVRLLNHIDKLALMVALLNNYVVKARIAPGFMADVHKRVVRLRSIDVGLAYAQHVEIGPVQYKDIHGATPYSLS